MPESLVDVSAGAPVVLESGDEGHLAHLVEVVLADGSPDQIRLDQVLADKEQAGDDDGHEGEDKADDQLECTGVEFVHRGPDSNADKDGDRQGEGGLDPG